MKFETTSMGLAADLAPGEAANGPMGATEREQASRAAFPMLKGTGAHLAGRR